MLPKTTAQRKIDQIEFYGGECRRVEPQAIYDEAEALAARLNGHYMDQFTYAERVTDWRGNNNIAESLFAQMAAEPHPEPTWVVMSAGTGGTSATIGRYIRYKRLATRLCVADPENSVFYDYFQDGDSARTLDKSSNVEGIGRPRVELSFQRQVIDRMLKVPDAASFAAIHFLEGLLRRKCGGSTGTNLYASLQIAAEMQADGQSGSIVTVICDPGERYLDTYYNPDWLAARGFDTAPYQARLQAFYETGAFLP